ncbi:TIGR02206 family membrane protein [Gracilibacillus oryzae]|uniref:TIGR02206 family membrane protein n=1 Tax=Gracilibacillus oryzae TaxID=1672701 RepID=A0A7C8KT50_9BACI|nr:TIGR02206 family membrane protein [Gracilibacillus oryzae]KAB8138143.1 TIGR02206 family membrane protein [Gracilibacillus oryzae]
MKGLYSFDQTEYPFQMFSLSHFFMILVTLVLLLFLYNYREGIKRRFKRELKYMLVVSLILGEVTFHLWYILDDRWNAVTNLPLQLCSISLYLCTIMLLTRNYRIFEISFFVSMTGAFIAIVTPELFFGFPHLRFFQFFLAHIAIVLSCFYMVWMEEYKPTFGSVIRSFTVLNIIAFFVFIVNQTVGSNYMFLGRKPSNGSIIDFLGPYPWYILSLEVVAFGVFVILYFVLFKLPKRH